MAQELREDLARGLIQAHAWERWDELVQDIPAEALADVVYAAEDSGRGRILKLLAHFEQNPDAGGVPTLPVLLRNCHRLVSEEALRIRIRLRCDELGASIALPIDQRKPLRSVCCDRDSQVAALRDASRSEVRRVLVRGRQAMGQRFFAMRCALYPDLLRAQAQGIYVRLTEDHLLTEGGCWAALAEALKLGKDLDHPDAASKDQIRALAESGTLLLCHGAINEERQNIDPLARYHAGLWEWVNNKTPAGRVVVLQAVEEARPLGLGGLWRRIKGNRPELADRSPFDLPGTLFLDPLGEVPDDQIVRFARNDLDYGDIECQALLDALRPSKNPDQIFMTLRARLHEPFEPDP